MSKVFCSPGVCSRPLTRDEFDQYVIEIAAREGWGRVKVCTAEEYASHRRRITDLIKALEAGKYDAAPAPLESGCSLKVEDLSPVMQCVTFNDTDLKLLPWYRRLYWWLVWVKDPCTRRSIGRKIRGFYYRWRNRWAR